MRMGVGLPNVIHGVGPDEVAEWSRRAEAGPFTSLGALHRASWEVLDPLESLALAAAHTERITLVTMVAVAPLYDTERLAREAAEIRSRAAGRLVLGLAVGARIEDYAAAGVAHAGRGERFDDQLESLPEMWENGGRPRILVGGTTDRAFARVARYADGYVHGGGPPRAFSRAGEKARAAWIEAGRPGMPELWGQSYFALGADAVEHGRAYMREYYAFTGPFAEKIAAGLLTTPQAIAAQLRGYAEAGCDEIVLIPAVADPGQVDRLAEVLP